MTVARLTRGSVLALMTALLLAACNPAGTGSGSSSTTSDDVKYGRAPGSAY